MKNVPKTLVAGLCLLALQTSVTMPVAHAWPSPPAAIMLPGSPAPTTRPAAKRPSTAVFELVINGKIEVDPICASEFPAWTRKLEFFDRPDRLCVRWLDKTPVEWARWELFKDMPGTEPDKKIATGDVPAVTLPNPSARWDIKLKDHLPLHNGGSADQKYFVKVVAKKKLTDAKAGFASQATLVHKPKAGEPVPPPGNPYSCGTAPDNHKREVIIEIPKMTVNKTSSTSGDGDRDELYFSVGRLGPGTSSGQKRLPSSDDYYEAKNGKTVGPSGWTNQDEDHVASPVLYKGNLLNNQVVDLAIAAQEQDNSDLKDAKDGLIAAMHGVAAVAGAVGGPYGAIVAAAAEAVAGAAQFIPNTKNHDFIGFVGLRLTNKCGNIQTTWTTFPEKNIAGVGTLTNQFLDVTTHDQLESRLAVISTNNQFWPNGVDYGEFAYAGASDEFWWIANGTSSSKYTFLLKARTTPPAN